MATANILSSLWLITYNTEDRCQLTFLWQILEWFVVVSVPFDLKYPGSSSICATQICLSSYQSAQPHRPSNRHYDCSIAQTTVSQLMFINDDATQRQMTVKQQITTVTVRYKYVTTRVAGDVRRVFMNHWTYEALHRQCWLSTSWPSVACCCDWRQMTQSVTLRSAVVPCRSSGSWTRLSSSPSVSNCIRWWLTIDVASRRVDVTWQAWENNTNNHNA